MDNEMTYIEVLEYAADTLQAVKQGASTDKIDSITVEVALQCIEEKISEIDCVLTKYHKQEEMNANISYLIKTLDNLDARMSRMEKKL